jgi:hypothetical protein
MVIICCEEIFDFIGKNKVFIVILVKKYFIFLCDTLWKRNEWNKTLFTDSWPATYIHFCTSQQNLCFY